MQQQPLLQMSLFVLAFVLCVNDAALVSLIFTPPLMQNSLKDGLSNEAASMCTLERHQLGLSS